jgi:hypothetical protein
MPSEASLYVSEEMVPGKRKRRTKQEMAATKLHPVVEAWLDEIPDKGTEWPREDFQSWLEIFRALLVKTYKIEDA